MKAADIRTVESLLRFREKLQAFIGRDDNPTHVGISVPSSFDLRMGFPNHEDSLVVYIEDVATVALILEHAKPAARKNLEKIEADLTALGVELS